MLNSEIAAKLEELADLYELDGAVVYRINAYRQAAEQVRESALPVADLAGQGRATELPGIGKTLQEKIAALVETGEIPAAAKLKKKWPAGLVEIMRLPGVGPKSAARLYQDLGVSSPEELMHAAEAEELRKLPGFGPRSEENILAALRKMPDRPEGRVLLSKVLEATEGIVERLRADPASVEVDVAGSARRMTETCHDADLVACSGDPERLIAVASELPEVAEVTASGEAGMSFTTHTGMDVDLRVSSPSQYGNLLQHFTGSKAHNIALREYAIQRGLHLSEHGVKDSKSGKTRMCTSEREVYDLLGLEFIEPEMREGRGEIEAAEEGRLPSLVGYDQVKGDLQSHTTLSDGRDTLEAMAEAARARGLKYLAITDHSASHGFGDNVPPDKLLAQIERIHALNRKMKGIKLLAGSEVNVLADGSLDYEDEVLRQLDWVIACVHSAFQMSRPEMTGRILTALEHPLVDAFAHPTGRLILERDPYAVDIEQLVRRAAETGTMLEINANPRRRDLSEQHARLAADAGVKLVISTDAHSTDSLGLTRFGIATARRAWLTPDDVANTRGWREFSKMRKVRAPRA